MEVKTTEKLEGAVYMTTLTSDTNFRVPESLRQQLNFDNLIEKLRTHWKLSYSWLWFIKEKEYRLKSAKGRDK